MPKSLCKIKKLLRTDLELYVEHVREPRFLCRSCGRVANKKKLLCSPQKIDKLKKRQNKTTSLKAK